MFATAVLSPKIGQVTVEYTSRGRRVTRTLPGMNAARRFYLRQSVAGSDPRVVRSPSTDPDAAATANARPTMSETTMELATPTTESAPETNGAAKKPAAKKATPKPKASAKPAPKKAALKARSATAAQLEKDILSFMRKGKDYTSRDVVLGVGRTPGAAGGGPVVKILKDLVARKVVAYASNEGKRGMCWVKR